MDKVNSVVYRLLILCLLFAFLACSPIVKNNSNISTIAREHTPGVVAINIVAQKKQEKVVFVASGFLVSEDLVATSYHILEENYDSIWVLWDNSLAQNPIQAKVVAENRKHDLLLLKLSHSVSIPPLLLAPKNSLALGESVVALGFPEATQNEDVSIKHIHVFQGSVASLQEGAGEMARLILDIRVMQGNSGGPVIKVDTGKVVGVVSEIIIDSDEEPSEKQTISIEGESVGIAIPAFHIQKLLREYQENEL